MIDQSKINTIFTENCGAALGVPVIKTNQTAPRPPYPFLTFTITRTAPRSGLHIETSGGLYREMTQTWSITSYSKHDNTALELAQRAADWLEETGHLTLADAGIVIRSVGGVTNRDTLITNFYEHRYGFDVSAVVLNHIENPDIEAIQTVGLTGKD